MSTIYNDNTTGGGMYAPSTGINNALTNPNGITGAHQSNGAGFSGNAEHFTFGDPFKAAPQGYTPYNPALGPTQQPLPTAPVPTAPNSAAPAVPGQADYITYGGPQAPVLSPAHGATDVFGTREVGSGVTGDSGPRGTGVFGEQLPSDPNEAYIAMCNMGMPPAEAAKAVISGQTPSIGSSGPGGPMGQMYDTAGGSGVRQSGGQPPGYGQPGSQFVKSGGPPPGFYGEHAGPIQGEAELGPSRQTGGGPPPGWNYQTGFGPNPPQRGGQYDATGSWGRGNGAMVSMPSAATNPYTGGGLPPIAPSSPGAQRPEHSGPIQGERELGPYGFDGVPYTGGGLGANGQQTGGPMGTISGGPPPGFYDRPPQRGGQYDTTSNPRQQTGGGLGPNLATGPRYQPTGPSPFDQYAANRSQQNPFGNNFFGGGGGGGGRYGFGQGSNVSMLQALMGGGGGGYGSFLSKLLSRNSGR